MAPATTATSMLRVRADSQIDTDLAIVGGGPAGSAAACHFARAGFRVWLIDQRHFPRDKVCGDFVGPRALAELDQLGLCTQPSLRDANTIRRAALYLNGNEVLARPLPRVAGLRDYGLCLPRMLLDDAIVQAAVAAGARLMEDTRVTGYETDETGVTLSYHGRTGPGRLRTRLLIGADGSASLIARVLHGAQPARRDRIVAVRAYFDDVVGTTEQADLYFTSSSFPGYCWVFPTGTSSANVGVGVLLEAWPSSRQQLGQLFADLIACDPAIRQRLAHATMRGKAVGWPLTTFNPRLPIIANRVALIGDAAGLINPLNGEGIQYALLSARWSLEALQDALSSDTVSTAGLRRYATRVQAELRYDMALSRLIVDLTRNRALNPLWLSALDAIAKRAASDSAYYDVAAAVLAGIAPAREMLAIPFLWYTVTQAAAMAGRAAASATLHRPRRLVGSRAASTDNGGSILKYSVGHPVATLSWGVHCALSLLELATQMAIFGRE